MNSVFISLYLFHYIKNIKFVPFIPLLYIHCISKDFNSSNNTRNTLVFVDLDEFILFLLVVVNHVCV